MSQKENKKEQEIINLLHQMIQPTKAMVYDHDDEFEYNRCDNCRRVIKAKIGICSDCFDSYMT